MNKKIISIIIVVLLVGISIGAYIVLDSYNTEAIPNASNRDVENVKIKNTNSHATTTSQGENQNANISRDTTRTISAFGLSWRQPIDWKIFSKEQDDNGDYFAFVGTADAVNGVENKGVSVDISNTDANFSYGVGPKLETTSSKEKDLDISKTVYGDKLVKSIHYEVSGEGINNTVYIRCMMGDESFFTLGEVQCDSLVTSFTNK